MRQAALDFIDEEAPGVGDVATPRRDILLGAAAKQIAFLEWHARRPLHLGGHISVRGIEDEPPQTFPQHVALHPPLHIALNLPPPFPSALHSLPHTSHSSL